MFSFISSIKVDATFDKNRGLNNKQIRPKDGKISINRGIQQNQFEKENQNIF